MRRRAAIGIDDDLAAGDAGVAVRSADHEASRRVHIEVLLRAHPAFREHPENVRTHDLADLVLVDVGTVLGRDHHAGRPHGLAIGVLQRDLALGVGAQLGRGPFMTRLGERFQDRVRVVDRRRHQLRRLPAGEAEHQALIASALGLVPRGIDALGDIGGLRVQQVLHLGRLPMEALLLVADVADRAARHLHQQILRDGGGAAHLAGQHHAVRGGQCLAADARQRIGGEESVHHRIRDAVADFVGMPFRHGFAGEEIIALGHVLSFPRPPRAGCLMAARAGEVAAVPDAARSRITGD